MTGKRLQKSLRIDPSVNFGCSNGCDVMICTKSGCKAHQIKNSQFCYWHDPDRAGDRKRASGVGGRKRRIAISDSSIMCIEDIKEALSVAIRELQQSNADVVQRTRAIAFVATTLMVAIDKSDILDRLELLEKRIT